MGFGVAAVVGVLVSAGATAYQIQSQNEQQKEAKKEVNRQAQEQDRLLKEAENRQAGKDKEAATLAQQEEANVQAKTRQKSKLLASGGRQGTILTSPLGVTSEAPTAGKTILGS